MRNPEDIIKIKIKNHATRQANISEDISKILPLKDRLQNITKMIENHPKRAQYKTSIERNQIHQNSNKAKPQAKLLNTNI